MYRWWTFWAARWNLLSGIYACNHFNGPKWISSAKKNGRLVVWVPYRMPTESNINGMQTRCRIFKHSSHFLLLLYFLLYLLYNILHYNFFFLPISANRGKRLIENKSMLFEPRNIFQLRVCCSTPMIIMQMAINVFARTNKKKTPHTHTNVHICEKCRTKKKKYCWHDEK